MDVMNNKSWVQLLIIIVAIVSNSCANSNKESVIKEKEAHKIIFDTDMGNDVDDALALDLIYKYIEDNKLEVKGIMSNKNSIYSAKFIDIMATWYGYEDIPIGVLGKSVDGPDSEHDAINYARAVCELKKEGLPMFKHSVSAHEDLPVAEKLYRKILALQPDSSVTIISVGFSTNLIRLLDTEPDEYSELNGRDLVAKKVKLLSAMLGSFGDKPIIEYNVKVDIPAAKRLFTDWPTSIVASPFEVGNAVQYPATSIENDFSWATAHPIVEAYKAYLTMPYDRPTWDLTSVTYVAEPDVNWFDESPKGVITVDEKGYTIFDEKENGKHSYLKISKDQAEQLKAHFVKLISRQPLKRKEQ